MDKSSEQIQKIKEDWIERSISMGYSSVASFMSTLYPIDFEAYQISFELCDSDGKTLDYFTFPIMPTDLSIKEDLPVKVENTFGGVSTYSSNVFVPKDISLSGNFGRQFKVLARNKVLIPFVSKVIQEREYGEAGGMRKEIEVSNYLKTGYGCFKVLQSIINRSVGSSYVENLSGGRNKLYFYNSAYGESYLVQPLSFKGQQSTNNNGIWNYELNMKAICPLHLDSAKSGNKYVIFGMNSAQMGVNNLRRQIDGMIAL